MLDLCADDMFLSRRDAVLDQAKYRQIVTFCGTAGKQNLVPFGGNDFRDPIASDVHDLSGLKSEFVGTSRVADFIDKTAMHLREYAWINWCRGVAVQVKRHMTHFVAAVCG